MSVNEFDELISDKLYHADSAVGSSTLRKLAQSPLYAQVKTEGSTFPFGTALHKWFLEREDFSRDIAVIADARTKAGKAAKANALLDGKTIITEKEMGKIMRLDESMESRPNCQAMLLGGQSELAAFCKHEYLDVRCKAKFDKYHGDKDLIVDLKTVSPMSPDALFNHVYQMKYHWQADWYCEIAKQITGRPHRWVFMFLQDREPYDIFMFELHPSAMDIARQEYSPKLAEYVECLKSGEFYGVGGPGNDIAVMTAPAWAGQREEIVE